MPPELVVERVTVEPPADLPTLDEPRVSRPVAADEAAPRENAPARAKLSPQTATDGRTEAGRPYEAGRRSETGRQGDNTSGIDIRWTEDGACVVELRGRPTRPMLAKARDLLWSRSPQDRLTVVVSDAVLTRELFAMLIAGRRRLSASGVFEIVGLDAPGARRIADSLRPPPR